MESGVYIHLLNFVLHKSNGLVQCGAFSSPLAASKAMEHLKKTGVLDDGKGVFYVVPVKIDEVSLNW